METPNAPSERRFIGIKQIDKPVGLRLGKLSKVVFVPHHDPKQGVLVLSQDRLLSKWQASQQTNDFSIGRSDKETTNDIEFRDEAISPNHLRVTHGANHFYSVEDRGSMNGTFEEQVTEVHGEVSVQNNEWAFTSLAKQPTLQIGPTLVRVETTGDKTYIVAGRRRIEISEGVPFTIGAGANNNLSIGEMQGNPFNRATLVYFNQMVFINSSDKPISIREQNPGATTQSQEAARKGVLLEQAL
ncbi:FHA domain-containing protein [Candidatus Microgenomates bacterium]|nr:FHA domain-containing protein [Candidatus Microgenomates bacterium]